ncbi:MAG: hypothetical protein L3J30_14500 [Marinosulfonomonas sp.]|nr:hypothetical protein [Marinosulfonomonas sp.]
MIDERDREIELRSIWVGYAPSLELAFMIAHAFDVPLADVFVFEPPDI